MSLNIERPIIFFDLETTGTNITRDRIVEISVLKIFPGRQDIYEYSTRVNPGMPIPADASAVHHIYDADVADAPVFAEIAPLIGELFAGSDIAGFNSNKFDLPLLYEEMARAHNMLDIRNARLIDVQTIFHKKEPRNLVAAYRFYCGKELEGAHSALADTRATYEVFKAQLEKYADLPDTIEGIAEFSSYGKNVDLSGRFIRDDQNRIVVNFGKYKGKVLRQILATDPSYYDWMLGSDFPLDTKQVITAVYNSLKTK